MMRNFTSFLFLLRHLALKCCHFCNFVSILNVAVKSIIYNPKTIKKFEIFFWVLVYRIQLKFYPVKLVN